MLSVALLTRGRICALVAGCIFAVSKTLWSQSIITEVYSLNVALYTLLLAMCICFISTDVVSDTSKQKHLYCVIALTFGLALSNHLTLMLAASPGLLIIVISQWRKLVQWALTGIGMLAIGLLPYVWMIARSWSDVEINFLGPINSYASLASYLLRTGYTKHDFQSGADFEDKLAMLEFYVHEFVAQMTFVGLAIGLFGLVIMLLKKTYLHLAIGMLVSLFTSSFLLVIIRSVRATEFYQQDIAVHPLVSYAILAVFFGYGLGAIKQLASSRLSTKFATSLISSLGVVAVVITTVTNWNFNNRRNYTWAHDYAALRLNSLPQNTALFLGRDLDFPVAYLNKVANLRPDVTTYNQSGLFFSNRLEAAGTVLTINALLNFARASDNLPIYLTDASSSTKVINEVFNHEGFWLRTDYGVQHPPANYDDIYVWLNQYLTPEIDIKNWHTQWDDAWTRHQSVYSVAILIKALEIMLDNGDLDKDKWQPLITKAQSKNPYAFLYHSKYLLESDRLDEQTAKQHYAILNKIAIDNQIFINPELRTIFYGYLAHLVLSFPQVTEKENPMQYAEDLLITTLDSGYYEQSFLQLSELLRAQQKHPKLIKFIKSKYSSILKAPEVIEQEYEVILNERLKQQKLQTFEHLPPASQKLLSANS